MRKVIGEDFMKEENLYLVNLMKYILEKKCLKTIDTKM